ncbi:MAG: M23 family metallopeptidase [Flavobacteriales bacterium]|nr:MAG: M23 family metallopeptidase [Flavobacteriales bacterium]
MKKIKVLFFLCYVSLFAQEELPDNYFSNPVKIPLVLSGNFGELRNNHFHSGLDIKTQQQSGIPIYAPADGFINRIKVSHFGYGKALYLKHPNGYQTVYAHLKKYGDTIQKFVKNAQYKKESYEIEIFPEANQLRVKKGDLIGYTGNSGSSDGPHLHFEIRDKNSRPMNPLLFGIIIPDTENPIATNLYAYPLTKDSQINQSQNPIKIRLISQKDGSYKAENITAFGKIGFGISTFDQQNGASNKNGVYEIDTFYNGKQNFKVVFEKFSFAETSYINRYIDYKYYKNNKIRIQKLFRESNNPLSIIKNENGNGILDIQHRLNSTYLIKVRDFNKNTIFISIPIIGERPETLTPEITNKTEDFVYTQEGYSITKGKFNIYIPANSLYEDTYLDIDAKVDTLKLHKDVIPLHKKLSISIDISNYNKTDIDKLYIGRLNYKKIPYYIKTFRKGNKLIAKTKKLGTFVLAVDTKNPEIKPINFLNKKWISKNKTLKIKITDDLSGISSYRATINGQFILMEYDYKKDVLTYDFKDQIISEVENNLKLIVIDNVGNNATFESTFYRK